MSDHGAARPLIAILRGIQPEEAVAIGGALVDAGIAMIEVPVNSPRPFESIARLAEALAGRARIGGGTITEPGQVADLAAAGGTYAVSPDCNPEVIAAAKARGMGSYPGVFTASECFTALRCGADGLKLFPAFALGPAGLRAILAVLPAATPVLAVGGVEAPQFRDWLMAGAAGFGLGSSLYKPGMDAEQVSAAARAVVQAYDAARASLPGAPVTGAEI